MLDKCIKIIAGPTLFVIMGFIGVDRHGIVRGGPNIHGKNHGIQHSGGKTGSHFTLRGARDITSEKA